MTNQEIINNTAEYVKEKITGEASGHDWWHVYRVWKNAIYICKSEKADMFIVELAALLHDLDDYKVNLGDGSGDLKLAKEWLEKQQIDENIISQICEIISEASFKGAKVESKSKTIEGKIIQDADYLDALGAIGIARAFAYGGNKGREMYDPEIKPEFHASFDQYKNNHSHSINHFYEKLLLLKDRMNTDTGKRIAEKRHKFLEDYLKEFYEEWDCKFE